MEGKGGTKKFHGKKERKGRMGVGRICVQRGEREGKCGRVVTAHSPPPPPPKGKFSFLGGGGEAKKAFYSPSFWGWEKVPRTILGLREGD